MVKDGEDFTNDKLENFRLYVSRCQNRDVAPKGVSDFKKSFIVM